MEVAEMVMVALASLAVLAGTVALVRARVSGSTGPPAHRRFTRSDHLAEARAEAGRILSEARAAAEAARSGAEEELSLRRASLAALEPLLEGQELELSERRRRFDEHRHELRDRREELEAQRASVEERAAAVPAALGTRAGLDRAEAGHLVLQSVEAELEAERPARVDSAVAMATADPPDAARSAIVQAIQRQEGAHTDGAARGSAVSLENLDGDARDRLLEALGAIAASTSTELSVDAERAQASLRGIDPIGREVARQATLEVVDRRLQAAEVGPLVLRTRRSLAQRVTTIGERALWEMEMSGRPELAELVGTLQYRFSYGQNALLHCEETGHLCGVLAAELGMEQRAAREAGMLHDIGKAVDHDVEGSHAIIGGELLRLFGTDPSIVHAVKAHHYDEEPSTDLALLTICADAISASRPGARRDTLAAYLARLEQLQGIATRHRGVERAFPLQAGREMRVLVRARDVGDAEVPVLSGEIAREIEAEMQYPGVIRVVVIRETTATATAPAQVPVLATAPAPEAEQQRAGDADLVQPAGTAEPVPSGSDGGEVTHPD